MQANENVLRHTGILSTYPDVTSIKERMRRLLPSYARKTEKAREQAILELEQPLIEQKQREVGHM